MTTPRSSARSERRQRRSEGLAFVPLSADVAPQLTLFGSPEPRSSTSAVQISAPVLPPSVPLPDETPARRDVPAFERRALLRSERHRLVSEVRRRDGSSHREINAWLNRRLGIASVEKATLDDLERSIALLERKLSAQR